jgi:chemotaxis protein CheY-P-specific phosphatase CheC
MRADAVARNLELLMEAASARASAALSQLLNGEIQVRCCRLYHGDLRPALLESLRGPDQLVTVSQTAFGKEPVTVSLAIDYSLIGSMLDLLFGRHGAAPLPESDEPAAPFDSYEIDALKETANIVTGTCIAVLEHELGLTGVSLPTFGEQLSPAECVCRLLPDPQSICIKSRLTAAARPLEIVLLMSIAGPPERSSDADAGGDATREAAPQDVPRLAAHPARS